MEGRFDSCRPDCLGKGLGVVSCEASDEKTATAALLHLGSPDDVRTQTARVFDLDQLQRNFGLLPR